MKIEKHYILPILSTGLLMITLLINHFRFELLGIVPGYAPHNFGFNMLFFLPSTILSLIGALIVLFRIDKIKIKRVNLIRVLIVLPIIALWTIQVIRILVMTTI